MHMIDISIGLNGGMLTYPKNMKPKIRMSKNLQQDGVNQSLICIESHTGTHVDAGYHAMHNGWKLGKRPISDFFGEAVVIDATTAGKLIRASDLKGHGIKRNGIVLLKTENSRHTYKRFRKDFASLAIDGAGYLKSMHIKAVGIDYLSIEKYGSDMSVHKALLSSGILIYEGLVLKGITPGRYSFFGLPIKYDGDAAPARVMLSKLA